VLRRKLTSNTNRLYEWAVFATYSVTIIVSSLINARVLPEKITGVNPLTTASTNQFRAAFYTYTAFSVLKVDSYALYFGPLFLIGEFFLQKNDQDFY
jgi:predicted permease